MLKSDCRTRCKVCGFDNVEPTWGEDGQSPSFDYCACCGVQFGYQDATSQGIATFRAKWLEDGAHWDEPDQRPPDWSLEAQLRHALPA